MVPEVSELHYRYDLIRLLPASFDYLLLKSDIGWILAIGWQGSVVGLSFAAGTIVRDFSLSQLGRIRFSQAQQNDFLIPQLFES